MALYPDIVVAVNAKLPPDVSTAASDGNPFFGEEFLQGQDAAPPRIVWVPVSGAYAVAQQRGSSVADPRALHTDQARVDVHCWGEDTASTLALKDAFVLAVRAALGPNYRPTGYRWVPSTLTALGRVCILTLDLNLPVTDAAPALAAPPIATPTTIDFSPSPGP